MKAGLLALVLLCVPALASAQDSVFRASLSAAVVAHSLDLATTMDLIGQSKEAERRGEPSRYYESNPYLGHVSRNPLAFAAVKMGTAAGSLWLTAKLHDMGGKKARALAIGINLAQTAVLTAVATHNYRIGRN